MKKINIGKPVFEGENIIAYAEDTYIVFKEDGQGELVIPNIERYGLSDGVRDTGVDGKVELFCPNVKVLNHSKNTWKRLDEDNIECSECGCRMNIKNVNNRAKLVE